MRIPGYEILRELERNEWHVLWEARGRDGRPVLLKAAAREPAPALAVELLERESEVLRGLGVPGVARIERKLEGPNGPVLVFDDADVRPLAAGRDGGVEASLALAASLASILAGIHAHDVVHGSLRPRCIRLGPDGALRIADFTTAWHDEGETDPTRVVVRDALPYVAPERTGRTGAESDERADLYSLGAVLFEILTGRPPFLSDDPLELVHHHIAVAPAPPSSLEPSVPEAVSAIVMKLLAKAPEERYQSAVGLAIDLEACVREWRARRAVAPFPLGRHDLPKRFLLPRRLYGRERELGELTRALERAAGGESRLVLVAGAPGVGKTSLIEELSGAVLRRGGHFVAGKFEQIGRNVPYAGLLQALHALVLQLLAESEERLAVWRGRLADALGSSAGVLAEVVPEISWILGPQEAPPTLGAVEAQNRFRLALGNLLTAVAGREHPLVVFLDDLQWADPATLGLIEPLLTTPDVRHVLVIGAYRDGELDDAHPLVRTLADLEPSIGGIGGLDRIVLGPLGLPDLRRFIGDALRGDPADAEPLARLVLEKTDGNPFFVIQFLTTLRREGLIELDRDAGRFVARIDAIVAAELTDNVVELMVRKIRRLPERTRQALMLAASIGSRFDLDTLSTVSETPAAGIVSDLGPALAERLIVASREAAPIDDLERRETRRPAYVFLHDRVQQAAYALIPDERRRPVHLAIGRLLRERGGDDESVVFEVVHHLNLAGDLVREPAERLELARLNLAAGRRAKESAAWQPALAWLRRGIELLDGPAAEGDPDLSMRLGIEAAECEFLCGLFDEAERSFERLLARADSPVLRAEIHRLRILQLENTSRYSEAVHQGREALRLYGLELPDDEAAKREALDRELARIRERLAGRAVASLVDLPVVEDKNVRSVMRLLTAVWASAYIGADQTLARLIPAILVRLSLEHGNGEESAFGYVTHAVTIGSALGDFETGYEFGRLALAVNERFGDLRLRAKVQHMFHCFVNPWRRPLATSLTHSREATRSGLESGDFAYASYAVFSESWYRFLTSRDLDRFVRETLPNVALLEKLRMATFVDTQKVILGWALALEGRTDGPTSLGGSGFDEQRYLETYGGDPFFMTFFLVARLSLEITFGRLREALETARSARPVVPALFGTIWPTLLDVFSSIAVGQAALAGLVDRAEAAREIRGLQARLDRVAESAPENFRCSALLLRAQVEHLEGSSLEAAARYEEALREARRSRVLWNQALASELFATFWLDRGDEEIALYHLGEARRRFREWGAAAKVRQLEERFPSLRSRVEPEGGPAPFFDATSVLKAAQAVAAETDRDALADKLVKIAAENAGAERVVFLREHEGRLSAETEWQAGDSHPRRPALFDQTVELPRSVVQYVRRTAEVVLIGSGGDERFAADPFLAAGGARSVLCLPVVHQGKLGGILYLENRLTANAFTPDRVRVLTVLSAQAAIALENARLCGDMREEIGRRRRAEEELRAALAEVERLKNRLEAENVYLQEEVRKQHDFEEMVGRSAPLVEVLETVERVAPTETTVLIQGETGTGKELIARAIHSRSPRRDRPLVKVNCGAIPAGLVESELFGHVKGAFTGALERRIGRFELADGGTIFLDEVGELPAETQVKLLRVLQERELEPVGSDRTLRVDVRIIAATNRDLEEAVAKGCFRADLFYRLSVFPIRVPPLRERSDDVPALVLFFLSQFARRCGKRIDRVAPATMERLVRYPWPGNVRELQNIIERAVVLSEGPVLELGEALLPVGHAPEPPLAAPEPAASPAPAVSLRDVERGHILRVLRETGGVIEGPKGAARVLNMHPNTLRSRMKKLGIVRATHEIS